MTWSGNPQSDMYVHAQTKPPWEMGQEKLQGEMEQLRAQVKIQADQNEALKIQLAEVSKKQGDLENFMESMQHYFQSEQVKEG